MTEKEPIRTIVFSLRALEAVIRIKPDIGWFENPAVMEEFGNAIVRTDNGPHCFILAADARDPQARITISLAPGSGFPGSLNPQGLLKALQRIHRIGVQAAQRNLSFPHNWNQFTADNVVTIFAYPIYFGSEKLIAHIDTSGVPDVYVTTVTKMGDYVDLLKYTPDLTDLKDALTRYEGAAREVMGTLTYLERGEAFGEIDLEAVSYGAVVAGRTYSTWLPVLSAQQRAFVHHDARQSLKLKGPAGSGKTLAMQLKLLREVYEAEREGRELRVLFVTHSWAVAQQVQEGLERLDEKGVLGHVDVLPLLTLAELEGDRVGTLTVLGDDSFSGKEAQLRKLAELVAEVRAGAWLTYRHSCSEDFTRRVEAPDGSAAANQFLWDIMLEFACVIGARGIFPGLNAIERYRELERRPWMMPLATDAEKEFVFYIYGRLIEDLLDEGQMTTDQMINDYLNRLSTFQWHGRRRRDGYDMIFVDELHLFNEQERTAFHHLTRNPKTFPIVFMAMDPRQSPAEYYTEFGAPDGDLRGSGAAELALGKLGSIDLDVVYRYTPQIHSFLVHLHQHYPTFELGKDWGVSVADAKSERTAGSVPTLYLHGTREEERDQALLDAQTLNSSGRRVALLCLDNSSFGEYKREAERLGPGQFQTVESREDVESLRYTTRTIVLSQPHYVAGLQFDAVVIGGFHPVFSQYDPFQGYGLRRFLSDLYLGASRARDLLHVHGNSQGGDFPPVIESALKGDVLAQGMSR